MNTKVLYGILAVIVIAIGAFVLTNGGGKKSAATTATTTASVAQPQTLKDLARSETPQKCEFEDSTNAAKTAGVVYVASGKVRGDFTATTQGKNYSAHMISDGVTAYTWMDGMATGFKVAFSTASTSEMQQGLDANKNLNYKCSSWTADQTMFQLPTSVKFTDMSATLKTGVSGSANACSACDLAPEPQRAQCRAALKCK
jgi:hypothetical protein